MTLTPQQRGQEAEFWCFTYIARYVLGLLLALMIVAFLTEPDTPLPPDDPTPDWIRGLSAFSLSLTTAMIAAMFRAPDFIKDTWNTRRGRAILAFVFCVSPAIPAMYLTGLVDGTVAVIGVALTAMWSLIALMVVASFAFFDWR